MDPFDPKDGPCPIRLGMEAMLSPNFDDEDDDRSDELFMMNKLANAKVTTDFSVCDHYFMQGEKKCIKLVKLTLTNPHLGNAVFSLCLLNCARNIEENLFIGNFKFYCNANE